MRIAVTGATGFIGRPLCSFLASQGHDVVPLARSGNGPRWDPQEVALDTKGPVDAVVHLAGHPVGVRWTEANKRRIRNSRVHGTENLAKALAGLDEPPAAFVCASAIGWYGDAGEEWVDESSPAGQGFLADVVQAWEAAPQPARDAGIRVVNTRFGVVLDPSGGALKRMLAPFRLGLGGPVAGGDQYLSWIARSDAVRALCCAITTPLEGPVNVVAPTPVRFHEFAATLARVLHRPSLLPLPRAVVRLAFGQMGVETITYSQRVLPRRLSGEGFQWEHPVLEEALRSMLDGGRPPAPDEPELHVHMQ